MWKIEELADKLSRLNEVKIVDAIKPLISVITNKYITVIFKPLSQWHSLITIITFEV